MQKLAPFPCTRLTPAITFSAASPCSSQQRLLCSSSARKFQPFLLFPRRTISLQHAKSACQYLSLLSHLPNGSSMVTLSLLHHFSSPTRKCSYCNGLPFTDRWMRERPSTLVINRPCKYGTRVGFFLGQWEEKKNEKREE